MYNAFEQLIGETYHMKQARKQYLRLLISWLCANKRFVTSHGCHAVLTLVITTLLVSGKRSSKGTTVITKSTKVNQSSNCIQNQ